MTNQEILNTYKKMGLGTQEERNQFLQWTPVEKWGQVYY